jgi:hypothetical protein
MSRENGREIFTSFHEISSVFTSFSDNVISQTPELELVVQIDVKIFTEKCPRGERQSLIT